MSVAAVAAVPAAPLLLPALSPAQPATIAEEVAALRADARAAWDSLPSPTRTVVLVAAGPEPAIHDGAHIDLAGYGVRGQTRDLPVDAGFLEALATRSGVPRLRQNRLDGDLGMLAAQVADARPDLLVVPLGVRGRSHRPALEQLAIAIAEIAATTEGDVALVAAGDLAATLDTTSPGYLVEGAADWDGRALEALRQGDVDAFAGLGPEEAMTVMARGWAPLLLALLVAQAGDVAPAKVEYRAPRGVGQVVAW